MGLVLKAAINLTQNHLPNNIADHLDSIGEPTAVHEKVAASMCQESSLVILGLNAYSSKNYQLIRSYTHILSSVCQTNLCELSEGSNSIGASMHHLLNDTAGNIQNLSDILHTKHDVLIMYGIEPNDTIYKTELIECMRSAKNLIVFTPYMNEYFELYADIIIPINTHYESSGSMINLELRNQSFSHNQIIGSKQFSNTEVLMSLYLGMGIQSHSIEEINDFIQSGIDVIINSSERISLIPKVSEASLAPDNQNEFNMYNIDNILRRSKPLQETKEGMKI